MGPLKGLRVVEFAGLGPAPFCGMLLSDLGADVVRIDRKDAGKAEPHHVTHRGRRSLALDLKNADAVALCFDLFERAEIVFEGFRPGVMERLGLGPDVALKRNPRLVYGRMTGWGQTGPLAHAAGHDINYIAVTEPQFYQLLREKAGLSDPAFDAQMDRARWPQLKEKVAAAIATKTRAEWRAIMEGSDVCFAPVLEMAEAPSYPHNRARDVFVDVSGVVQPAPAPRFSRTPGKVQRPPPEPGQHGQEVLADWGFSASEIRALRQSKALG